MQRIILALFAGLLFACSAPVASTQPEPLPAETTGPYCEVHVTSVTWRLKAQCEPGNACQTAYGQGQCVPALTCYDGYSGAPVDATTPCQAEDDACALPEGRCGVTR
jgi:hypothetical protein